VHVSPDPSNNGLARANVIGFSDRAIAAEKDVVVVPLQAVHGSGHE